jgi:hypothetical protein
MCFAARLPWRRRAFHPRLRFASSSQRRGRNGLMVRKVSDAGTPARSPCLPRPLKKCAKPRHNHNHARPPAPSRHPRHHHLPCPSNPKAGTRISLSPGTWSTAGRNRVDLLAHFTCGVAMNALAEGIRWPIRTPIVRTPIVIGDAKCLRSNSVLQPLQTLDEGPTFA